MRDPRQVAVYKAEESDPASINLPAFLEEVDRTLLKFNSAIDELSDEVLK